jgi:hypothetical protein
MNSWWSIFITLKTHDQWRRIGTHEGNDEEGDEPNTQPRKETLQGKQWKDKLNTR